MLVIGGYLLTYGQLRQLGLRRGLVIEDGKVNIQVLNSHFGKRWINFIYTVTWPVAYPRHSHDGGGARYPDCYTKRGSTP